MKRFAIIILFISLAACKAVEFPLTQCMRSNAPVDYQERVTKVESYLINGGYLENGSLASIKNLVRDLRSEEKYKEFRSYLDQYTYQVPSPKDIAMLKGCCRGNLRISSDFHLTCELAEDISIEGISVDRLYSLASQMSSLKDCENIYYRGSILNSACPKIHNVLIINMGGYDM